VPTISAFTRQGNRGAQTVCLHSGAQPQRSSEVPAGDPLQSRLLYVYTVYAYNTDP
jgi:hypothetical protein